MVFQILIGKSYLLDKNKKIIHDLSRRKFVECRECRKSIRKIRWRKKNRQYLMLHEALIKVKEGSANGCETCMPGMHIKK